MVRVLSRKKYMRPKNVFLPEFVIALIHTPFLPPRYASFYVPLEFNKLDMRDYMKKLYNVDILRIRSYVEQQKVTRQLRDRMGQGPLRRPKSKKKMTIEMFEPFVWPQLPQDQSAWEKEQFYNQQRYSTDIQESKQPAASAKPVKNERESFEQQAKDLLEGKTTWKPTWQALGLRYDRPSLAKFSVTQPKEAEKQTESIESSDSTDSGKPSSSTDP
ncbi:hypothetical protein UA08_08465 [Talaromyces atroroseus]|uniref:Large ribosomal subunit protein uL23m n=1 Tax=Talaromyces atroroseus TaxID=1441469 RepID=A0A1Q5Q828_TALAT|nr:hypothetical protein UA08_08465 [Talaromyces atroroseus]OKL56281.1 hypothetical protein UA08_08465 [Talaromyces atroroseus]